MKNFFKKVNRFAGIEPSTSSPKEKLDGSVDQRGQRGPSRTPAQKLGDAKRKGQRRQ